MRNKTSASDILGSVRNSQGRKRSVLVKSTMQESAGVTKRAVKSDDSNWEVYV